MVILKFINIIFLEDLKVSLHDLNLTLTTCVDLNRFINKLKKRIPAPSTEVPKPPKILMESSTTTPPVNFPQWAVSSEWMSAVRSVFYLYLAIDNTFCFYKSLPPGTNASNEK